MSVSSLRKQGPTCPQDCNGNGWCNNKGHCHCKDGFAPPHCDYPGAGGSLDSGPASDPNGMFFKLSKTLWVINVSGAQFKIIIYVTYLLLLNNSIHFLWIITSISNIIMNTFFEGVLYTLIWIFPSVCGNN